MQKLRIGDKVKVLVGKDKGREGKIEKIFPKKGTLVIPGMNMYKKHVKTTPGGQQGGIFDLSRAISGSKVGLICPRCNKRTRIGFKFVGNDKKRICKKCKKEIDIKAKPKKK